MLDQTSPRLQVVHAMAIIIIIIIISITLAIIIITIIIGNGISLGAMPSSGNTTNTQHQTA